MQAIGAFDHDYQWLVDRVGCFIDPGFRAIKIVDEGGRIHGMVGYGAWTENSVMCHIALDNPAALRTMVTAGFKYPFEMAGRGVMLATVRASNVRSYRLCRRLGFEEAYRIKDGIAVGEDIILMQMRREDCRFLSRKAA
jgi:RimJ/RimL family protein N-acetyltransferase